MKKVLITGATGCIGEEIVNFFAKNNYYIYLHYNNNIDKAKEILKRIGSSGELIKFNIKNKNDIKNALKNIDVDVLINNAGITKDKLFFFMEDEDWEDVINTNLNSIYYVTKQVVKNMILKKSGSIVNISSVAAISGNIGQANYSASKGGIISLTKTLSLELGRYNIRVNALAPGLIKSKMTEKIPNIKNILKNIPLNREGTSKEIAECAFFLGNNATYITGETLNINGGMYR